MSVHNVFDRLCPPTETDYVNAVRRMMLGLAQHHTQKYLAERLGVDPQTIHNAQEGKSALKGWVITRIEWEFGREATKPVRDLGGGERDREPELADAIRPHIEAVASILAEQATSRLNETATRGKAVA